MNDDFQIHFIYLLDKKTKDKEWDINGDIEKLTAKANDKLLEITAKNMTTEMEIQLKVIMIMFTT